MRIEKKEEPPPRRQRLFAWLADFFLRNRGEFLDFFNTQARRGLLDDLSHRLVCDVLRLHDLRVRDVMVPRSQMKVISSLASFDEIMMEVAASGHARFPVVGDDLDDIEGILLAKNLSSLSCVDNGGLNIRDHICQPFVVPESRRLIRLLDGFKLAHTRLAIVVDEYGCTSGLVASSDVLGQVFGSLVNSDDVLRLPTIRQLENGHFLVDGLTPLSTFNSHFSLSDNGEKAKTVGGMVVNRLRRLPATGEKFELRELGLEVKSADGRRILELIVAQHGK